MSSGRHRTSMDGNGLVGPSDLLLLLGNWGSCGDCYDWPADLDDNCAVGGSDVLVLLAIWAKWSPETWSLQ